LRARLAPLAARAGLPTYPLGTDFDPVEQRLVPALQWLKGHAHERFSLALASLSAAETADDATVLERMGLTKPRGVREWMLRKALLLALRKTEVNASQ
jgi:hypothetical protein